MKRLAVIAVLMLTGCKASDRAQLFSMGSSHRVVCWSGTTVIGDWVSVGNVSNQEHSDGYYFEDAKTGKLVEVSGACVVTQI